MDLLPTGVRGTDECGHQKYSYGTTFQEVGNRQNISISIKFAFDRLPESARILRD